MTRGSVWIVNPYGTLPSEPWSAYRSTMLAEALVGRGYRVTQFISNFEHRTKTFRTAGDAVVAAAGYTIRIVPAGGYVSHISLRRIRYERTFARNLLKAVGSGELPDYVILAEPAVFYYDILLDPLIRRGGSSLVLDVIDLWPELFELAIPKLLRPFSPILLAPFFSRRRRLYRHAKAVVAVAADYLVRAKALARRKDVIFEVVYWSWKNDYTTDQPAATESVQQLVAAKSPRDVWVVYAGTLGENYDIASIVEVARQFARERGNGRRVTFVVAGDGPLRRLCEGASENLVFLGRLNPAQLGALYRHCDVALATYRGESTVAMPIKAFDYLRWGLPIVNSLGRDLGALVRENHIGLNYQAGSAPSLRRAIEILAADPELRRRCAANARALADRFRADVQYAKFADVLDRLPQRLRRTQ